MDAAGQVSLDSVNSADASKPPAKRIDNLRRKARHAIGIIESCIERRVVARVRLDADAQTCGLIGKSGSGMPLSTRSLRSSRRTTGRSAPVYASAARKNHSCTITSGTTTTPLTW